MLPVTDTDETLPFDAAWFDTVFLVPRPPAAWPRAFAVVTAHNPGGVLADPERNRSLEKELDELLAREGLESFGVVGASPDLAHREEGRGIVVDSPEAAARIAARFGQAGFFWVEDGEVFIGVDASGRGWPVASWSQRLVETLAPRHGERPQR